MAALLLAVDRDGHVVVPTEAERILLTASPRLWIELDEALALALPALSLRAVDWVPVLRDRSRAALERCLAEPSGAALVMTAAIALALRERRGGRWLADRVETRVPGRLGRTVDGRLTSRDRPVA